MSTSCECRLTKEFLTSTFFSVSLPLPACSPGYYCDVSNNLDNYVSYPCPAGHYCINGTQWSTQYPCPAGTYSPNTQLEDVSQCIQCDAGKYCATAGQSNYTG